MRIHGLEVQTDKKQTALSRFHTGSTGISSRQQQARTWKNRGYIVVNSEYRRCVENEMESMASCSSSRDRLHIFSFITAEKKDGENYVNVIQLTVLNA